MKPVYSVQIVDKIFFHLSDEILANIAIDFLHVFQSANFERCELRPHLERDLFSSERMRGVGSCVIASPGDVRIDFSKATIQGWAYAQVYDAETVIDEILYRARKRGISYNDDVEIAYLLELEIDRFIDKFCVPRGLNARDIIRNSQETCRILSL